MNFVRILNDYLRRYPRLRLIVRKTTKYIGALCGLFVPTTKFEGRSIQCDLGYENFFGYYDKNPENSRGEILIHVDKGSETSSKLFACCVASDLKSTIWEKEISVWNYQQGSRLHWLTDDYFIFNHFDFKQGSTACILVNIINNCEKQFKYPVQETNEKWSFYISIDYVNLNHTNSDYGYLQLKRKIFDPGVAFKIIKLDTGEKISDYNYSLLHKICGITDFDDALECVNHFMSNPSGKLVVFIYRRYQGNKRNDYLILWNTVDDTFRLLNDYHMVSHVAWLTESKLVGYLQHSRGNRFYEIDVAKNEFKLIEGLRSFGDGHPTVINENQFIFDTYPNILGNQSIYKSDLSGKTQYLGTFKHPLKLDGASRCDLHPRFSRFSSTVFIDNISKGRRRLAKLFLDE